MKFIKPVTKQKFEKSKYIEGKHKEYIDFVPEMLGNHLHLKEQKLAFAAGYHYMGIVWRESRRIEVLEKLYNEIRHPIEKQGAGRWIDRHYHKIHAYWEK